MNWYNLNISIDSILLLRTYEPTQLIHKNNSNYSIESINQLIINFDLFSENPRFRSPVLTFFESIDLIQSYQSLKVNLLNYIPFENELTQFTNQLAWKKNWINPINFAEKNESIQFNQLNRVDWYTNLKRSLSWIRSRYFQAGFVAGVA